jgi:hypothetical protein
MYASLITLKYNKNFATSISCYESGVVAHTCNPSYLGGRDLKDHDKSSQNPISNLGMSVMPEIPAVEEM